MRKCGERPPLLFSTVAAPLWCLRPCWTRGGAAPAGRPRAPTRSRARRSAFPESPPLDVGRSCPPSSTASAGIEARGALAPGGARGPERNGLHVHHAGRTTRQALIRARHWAGARGAQGGEDPPRTAKTRIHATPPPAARRRRHRRGGVGTPQSHHGLRRRQHHGVVRRRRVRLRCRSGRQGIPARGLRIGPDPVLPGCLRRHLRRPAAGRGDSGAARRPPRPQGGPRLHPHDDGAGDLRNRCTAARFRARHLGAHPAYLPQARSGLLHRWRVRGRYDLRHRVRPRQAARLLRGHARLGLVRGQRPGRGLRHGPHADAPRRCHGDLGVATALPHRPAHGRHRPLSANPYRGHARLPRCAGRER